MYVYTIFAPTTRNRSRDKELKCEQQYAACKSFINTGCREEKSYDPNGKCPDPRNYAYYQIPPECSGAGSAEYLVSQQYDDKHGTNIAQKGRPDGLPKSCPIRAEKDKGTADFKKANATIATVLLCIYRCPPKFWTRGPRPPPP